LRAERTRKSQTLRKEKFKASNHIQVNGVRVETIEHLRKLAELNLCDSCFQKYKAFLEPTIQSTIQSLRLRPLGDWIETESEITQIVMKNKGVFKGKAIVLFLGNDENKITDMVDVKAFNQIKKWKFNEKINYLHATGVLQDSSYELLDKARETRNRLHDLIAFSEQDYALFHLAYIITNQIWTATMTDQKDISIWLKTNAEKNAKQWLESQK
jgi:hypothetical protein